MKSLLSYLILGFMVISGFSCKTVKTDNAEDFTQYVDPMIGTAHCRWFHVAPGCNPFGLAKPGPSTDGHL